MIDRTYALDDVVEATRYLETGRKTGNVVLRVSEAAPAEQPESAAKHEEETASAGRVATLGAPPRLLRRTPCRPV